MEQIAGNPPGAEKDDICFERNRVENNALETIKTMSEVVPTDEHHRYGIGDRKDEEIVVAQRLNSIAMGKSIQSTLKTTGRTKCSCA